MRNTVIAVVLVAACFFARQAKADSFTLTNLNPPGGNDYIGIGNASVTFQDSGGNSVTFTQSGTLGQAAILITNGNVLSSVADYIGPYVEDEANIDIVLPFDVTSFSADFGTDVGTNVTFALSENGDLVDSVIQSSTPDNHDTADETFSIIDSPTPFDSVLVTTTETSLGNGLNIGNLAYTTPAVAVTPEPRTLFLLGSGLLLLLGGLTYRDLKRRHLMRSSLAAA